MITAATQNGVKVRGKLTLHFAELQRQAEADAAADRCATVAIALLREAPDHERLIGAEAALSAQILQRYPTDVARARGVELAALHVVGDPALSDELRRASSTAGPVSPILGGTPSPPSARPNTPPSAPPPPAPSSPTRSSPPMAGHPAPMLPGTVTGPSSDDAARHSSRPPAAHPGVQHLPVQHAGLGLAPASTPAYSGAAGQRRRGASQIRSIQSLLMPPGTPPQAMGAFVAPLVRDSAARLLIGFLRAHDLITLRGVVIDEGSAEVLANLVPISDAPPGGYEASRAPEIARWQGTIGAEPIAKLLRETGVISVHLAEEAMIRAEVSKTLASAVIEAVCVSAFPDDPAVLSDIERFADLQAAEFVAAVAHNLTSIAAAGDDPVPMTAALGPLVGMMTEDLNVAAMIIKLSAG
ncbi:MAG: hypothetical protein ABI193_01415 [Minicystis sp.]